MIHVANELFNVVIFGNEKFPGLPVPIHCMFHSTLKGAEEYLSNVPVDVIFVGVSNSDPSLENNLSTFVKASPSAVLIALVKDYPEAEQAMSYGASDYMLISGLNANDAAESARKGIARSRYLKQSVKNHLYTYNNLTTISKSLLHDIRNTLSGIVLSLEPIRDAVGNNESAKTYVEILARAYEKLNQVVNDFSLATGNVLVTVQDEDFNGLIRYAVANLPAGTLRNAKLIQKYSDESAVQPFDRKLIAMAIEHLISNACDAVEGIPDAEIKITTAIDNDSATLTISDNGQGIDHLQLQHVFHPYFTTRDGKAGLGLPIANSIISAHGGTLRINSSNVAGIDVVCRFPLRK